MDQKQEKVEIKGEIKKTRKKKPSGSKVISFRLKDTEFAKLAAEAYEKKMLPTDLARAHYKEGQQWKETMDQFVVLKETLESQIEEQKRLINEVREQQDQLAQNILAQIDVSVARVVRKEMIEDAIRKGVAVGIQKVISDVFQQGGQS